MFEEQPTWWDVLCNINTGKVTVSRKIEPMLGGTNGSGTEEWLKAGSWEGEADFVQEVNDGTVHCLDCDIGLIQSPGDVRQDKSL